MLTQCKLNLMCQSPLRVLLRRTCAPVSRRKHLSTELQGARTEAMFSHVCAFHIRFIEAAPAAPLPKIPTGLTAGTTRAGLVLVTCSSVWNSPSTGFAELLSEEVAFFCCGSSFLNLGKSVKVVIGGLQLTHCPRSIAERHS